MKKQATPSVSMSYANCTIVSSEPMVCPLCGLQVQPMVTHACSKPEVPAKKPRPRRRETRA